MLKRVGTDKTCRNLFIMFFEPQKLFLLILLIFFLSVFFISVYIFKHWGNPLPRLFLEFDKKMWMTIGLGLLFFGFYFIFIPLLALSLNSQKIQTILSFIRHHPTLSIYMGLLIFILFTLSIYLARLFIKYLYRNRTKKL